VSGLWPRDTPPVGGIDPRARAPTQEAGHA
jgi:hypothetical protein